MAVPSLPPALGPARGARAAAARAAARPRRAPSATGGDDIPHLARGRPGGGEVQHRPADRRRAASWCSTTSACRSTSTCRTSAAGWPSGGRAARGHASPSAPAPARFGDAPAAAAGHARSTCACVAAQRRSWSPRRLHGREHRPRLPRPRRRCAPLAAASSASRAPVDLGARPPRVAPAASASRAHAPLRGHGAPRTGSRCGSTGGWRARRARSTASPSRASPGDVAWDDERRPAARPGARRAGRHGARSTSTCRPRPGRRAWSRPRCEGMDAEGAARASSSTWARPGWARRPRGDARRCTGRAGGGRALTGRVTLDLAPRADGRTPLARAPRLARRGRRAARRGGRPPHARHRRRALRGHASSRDRPRRPRRRGAQPRPRRRRRAAACACAARWAPRGASRRACAGAGRFRGPLARHARRARLRGPLHRRRTCRYLGVALGPRGVGGQRSTPREVRSHSLVLRRRGGELWLDGRDARPGATARRTRSTCACASTAGRPPTSSRRSAGTSPCRGCVSGRGRGRAAGAARPWATRRSPRAAGRYDGVPYAGPASVRTLPARAASTEVTAGRARVGGGTVDFRGTARDDGDLRRRGAGWRDVELGALLPGWPPALRWGGRVSGHACVLQGTLARPAPRGPRSSSPRLFLGDEGVGRARRPPSRAPATAAWPSRRAAARRASTCAERQRGRRRAPYAADLSVARARDQPRPLPARALPGAARRAWRWWPRARPRSRARSQRPRALARGRPCCASCELLLPEYPVREPRAGATCTLARRAARGAARCTWPARAPTSRWRDARPSLGDGAAGPRRARRRRPARAVRCSARELRGRGRGAAWP